MCNVSYTELIWVNTHSCAVQEKGALKLLHMCNVTHTLSTFVSPQKKKRETGSRLEERNRGATCATACAVTAQQRRMHPTLGHVRAS